jgi:MFS family permease
MQMKPNRAAVAGAYAVALLLVVVPLSEMTLRVWPLRFTEVSWRFGTVGLFSNALLSPLLGLTVAGMLAFLFGHRRAIRALAIVLMAAALLLAGAMVLFMLDALQMRGNVVTEARVAFDMASAQAIIKMGLFTIVSFVLGIGGWRSAHDRDPRRSASQPAAGLIRQPDAAPDVLQTAGAGGPPRKE